MRGMLYAILFTSNDEKLFLGDVFVAGQHIHDVFVADWPPIGGLQIIWKDRGYTDERV